MIDAATKAVRQVFPSDGDCGTKTPIGYVYKKAL